MTRINKRTIQAVKTFTQLKGNRNVIDLNKKIIDYISDARKELCLIKQLGMPFIKSSQQKQIDSIDSTLLRTMHLLDKVCSDVSIRQSYFCLLVEDFNKLEKNVLTEEHVSMMLLLIKDNKYGFSDLKVARYSLIISLLFYSGLKLDVLLNLKVYNLIDFINKGITTLDYTDNVIELSVTNGLRTLLSTYSNMFSILYFNKGPLDFVFMTSEGVRLSKNIFSDELNSLFKLLKLDIGISFSLNLRTFTQSRSFYYSFYKS